MQNDTYLPIELELVYMSVFGLVSSLRSSSDILIKRKYESLMPGNARASFPSLAVPKHPYRLRAPRARTGAAAEPDAAPLPRGAARLLVRRRLTGRRWRRSPVGRGPGERVRAVVWTAGQGLVAQRDRCSGQVFSRPLRVRSSIPINRGPIVYSRACI
jgi:hypothetical protein